MNVIQSMILTDGNKMLLTPTYHVNKIYVPFQGAEPIPVKLDTGEYRTGDIVSPQVDAIAARGKDGRFCMALTNLDPNNEAIIAVAGRSTSASGQFLSADTVDAVNSYEIPNEVVPRLFSAKTVNGRLLFRLPSKSVVVVQPSE